MNEGLTDGTSPGKGLTREQMITILWRYAGSPMGSSDLSKFSDAGSISNYAADAMVWAVEKGIVEGANGTLMPRNKATRAQVAAMIQRFAERRASKLEE